MERELTNSFCVGCWHLRSLLLVFLGWICHLACPSIFHPLKHCGFLCTCVRWHHLILALTRWETCGDILWLTAVTFLLYSPQGSCWQFSCFYNFPPTRLLCCYCKTWWTVLLNSFLIKGQCSTLPGRICGCGNLQAAVPENWSIL